MSENSQRIKWWEKYRNKEVNMDVDRNIAELRDLIRAAFLRAVHEKIDALDIEKIIDNIIQRVKENRTDLKIGDFILYCTSELNKHKEFNDEEM